MAKKAVIEDILEIPTKKGLAYAQFSHYHEPPPTFGHIIRVLHGFYQERPKSFQLLADQKEIYYTLYPLQAVLNGGNLNIVGHAEIPEFARKFPLFRSGCANQQTGKVDVWWLWDGTKEWKIGQLTEEQMDLPLRASWGTPVLISRIEEGWTPRYEEAFRQAKRLRNKVEKTPSIKAVRHFLLFEDKGIAENARQLVNDAGFESNLVDHGTGFILGVRQGMPLTEEYIENLTIKLTEIARKAGGRYDAWETEL